jgi:regulatory protein
MRKPLPRKPDSIHALNLDVFEPDDEPPPSAADARKKAMDYLARREYGRQELVRKLQSAGFDAELSESAVEVLADEGLQDDTRFVENFIQSRVSQGKGPLRIQADLGQRGPAIGLVERLLEDSDVDWYALAARVRRKKFGEPLPTEFRDRARQMRFLQSRGFEQSHIQSALRGTDVD